MKFVPEYENWNKPASPHQKPVDLIGHFILIDYIKA